MILLLGARAFVRLNAALLGVGSTLLATAAWSQTTVDLDVAATTVEVGQPFAVQMQALTSEGTPDSPRLKVPTDFEIQGPNVGSNHQVSFVNGRLLRRSGINATWQLIGKRAGVFTLGPASVNTEQGKAQSRSLSIKVVAAGSLPRPKRRGGFPFDDDDLFGGLGGFGGRRRSLLDEMFGRGEEEAPPAPPPEFSLDVAPDPRAFVRAVVQPENAVVGQQVTLDIYAYGSQGRFRENNPHEPRRSDFYSYSLIENSAREPTYVVKIGDTDFYATRIRRYALFPLKAGELEIGPMELNLYGSGYATRQSPDGLLRRTKALTVHVTEPDLKDRPLGYQVGDVGDYKLEANVAPRTLTEGDSLSVSATLEGLGNLPGQLLTPEQKGTTWLTPTVKGEAKQISEGVIGGTRTFTYVVKLERAGEIDLGALLLPHYNPKTGQYVTARAELGKVQVSAKAQTSQAEVETPRPPLAAALIPATQLGPPVARKEGLPSRPWFWWLALGSPALVVAAAGLQHGGSRVLSRLRAERASLKRQSSEALSEAKSLHAKGEPKSAYSAIERALYLAIEAHTAVRGRGMLQPELAAALAKAQVDETLRSDIVTLFAELDQARFAPAAGAAAELLQRAERALGRLNQKAKAKA